MNFRTRVSLYTLVAAIIPITIAMGLTLWLTQKHTAQEALDRASVRLNVEAQNINDYFVERKAEITTYANLPDIRQQPFKESLPFLTEELKRHNGIYDKFVLSLRNGHFLTTNGGNPWRDMIQTFDNDSPAGTPRSLTQRSYWQILVGKNTRSRLLTHISNPVISLTTDRRQIVIGASIVNNGQLVGMIGGTVPWQHIAPSLESAQHRLQAVYPSAKMILVSQDGGYWHHYNRDKEVKILFDEQGQPLRTSTGEKKTAATNIHTESEPVYRKIGIRMSREESGYMIREAHDQDQYLFFQPIPSANYAILMEVDRQDIFSPVTHIMQYFVLSLFLAIIIAVVVSLLFSRQVATPIKRLIDTARKIQDHPDKVCLEDFKLQSLQVSELNELNRSFYLMARKIAEREQKLSDRKERFKLAMQGANDGLWDWDIETGSVYFSTRWLDMLGYQPGEIEGRVESWEALIYPDDLGRVRNELNRYLCGQTPYYDIEFRMRHKKGHVIYVQSRGTLVRNEYDKPIRMVGTHTDITRRKDAEHALQQLNDELESRVRERTFELEQAYKALKKQTTL